MLPKISPMNSSGDFFLWISQRISKRNTCGISSRNSLVDLSRNSSRDFSREFIRRFQLAIPPGILSRNSFRYFLQKFFQGFPPWIFPGIFSKNLLGIVLTKLSGSGISLEIFRNSSGSSRGYPRRTPPEIFSRNSLDDLQYQFLRGCRLGNSSKNFFGDFFPGIPPEISSRNSCGYLFEGFPGISSRNSSENYQAICSRDSSRDFSRRLLLRFFFGDFL